MLRITAVVSATLMVYLFQAFTSLFKWTGGGDMSFVGKAAHPTSAKLFF